MPLCCEFHMIELDTVNFTEAFLSNFTGVFSLEAQDGRTFQEQPLPRGEAANAAKDAPDHFGRSICTLCADGPAVCTVGVLPQHDRKRAPQSVCGGARIDRERLSAQTDVVSGPE